MYAIIIKRAIEKPIAADQSQQITNTEKENNVTNIRTVRYDDEIEPEDEEYDIYIGGIY